MRFARYCVGLMPMRYLLCFSLLLLFANCAKDADSTPPENQDDRPPNLVVIFTDDLGYGDVGAFGSTRAATPHLDSMAAEGLKLTNFYAFPSCSPSRAALLTGCYPPRVGIPDVIGPEGPDWTADRQYGLSLEETTVAEVLKGAGYATGMVGKWHLGHWPNILPFYQGFDSFYGLPYSNDMIPEQGYPDLLLYDQGTPVEVNPNQRLLTKKYTERAVEFIDTHQESPFFLYLAHSMPHVPLYTSLAFADNHPDDLFASVIEEIDWSVGQVLKALRERNLDDNTLVVFTSDNGPWLSYGNHAGSAGPFREGKGTTFEGGMRVPAIVWGPNMIKGGSTSDAVTSVMDILPTFTALSGGTLPTNKLDGRDLTPLFQNNTAPAATPFYYFRSGRVEAVRLGDWKLHLPHEYRTVSEVGNDGERGIYTNIRLEESLYNLAQDAAEEENRAAEFPEKTAELRALAEAMQRTMDREKREPYRAKK